MALASLGPSLGGTDIKAGVLALRALGLAAALKNREEGGEEDEEDGTTTTTGSSTLFLPSLPLDWAAAADDTAPSSSQVSQPLCYYDLLGLPHSPSSSQALFFRPERLLLAALLVQLVAPPHHQQPTMLLGFHLQKQEEGKAAEEAFSVDARALRFPSPGVVEVPLVAGKGE